MAKGAKAARVHEGVTALVRQGGRERREGGKGGVGAPGGRAVIRDGNGYPKPETRWVFALLGCGHRLNSIPAGF